MRIAILTLGTRGDVQPYAVLGQALKQRGHVVTLSTAQNFETLVKSYGINFLPLEADYQAFINSDEGKKLMGVNPFAIYRNLETWIYPMIQQSLTEFYNLAKQSDRIIYHVSSMADCFADQFPTKMIGGSVAPALQPTKSFACPGFSGLPIPSFLNTFSYKIVRFGMKMISKPIKRFRRGVGLSEKYMDTSTPYIYGISPKFLEKPPDYPSNSFFTGFWFGTSSEELPDDLLDFINRGEEPLLVTFGSMPFIGKLNLQKALINLSVQLKTRIIVVKGWGLDNLTELEQHENIKVISSAPYEKLFPHVKAIVHHGGAGTTSECLRAGKPFFTCPVLFPLGDQQFWGQLGYKKGVAVKPVPLKKMTETLLINKVKELLTTEQLYVNSKLLADQIKHEDGVMNAVKIIETLQ